MKRDFRRNGMGRKGSLFLLILVLVELLPVWTEGNTDAGGGIGLVLRLFPLSTSSSTGQLVAFRGFCAQFLIEEQEGPQRGCDAYKDLEVVWEPSQAADVFMVCNVKQETGKAIFTTSFVAYQVGALTFWVQNGAGLRVEDTPFVVDVLPTSEATFGCVRPGVTRNTCIMSVGKQTHLPTPWPAAVDHLELNWSAEGNARWKLVAECQVGSSEGCSREGLWSSMREVDDNLFAASNVCLHENKLHLFAPGSDTADVSDERLVMLDSHGWGNVQQSQVLIQEHFGREDAQAFAERVGARGVGDGDVGAGAGPVYIVPEGPSSHPGHTYIDSVLPLCATALSVQENRSAFEVVLWPSASYTCPVKGSTVHSSRFWDFFLGATADPRSNVRRLGHLMAIEGAVCFREVYLGILVDWRVTRGSIVPFEEELPYMVGQLRRNLGFAALPPHPTRGEGEILKAILIHRLERSIVNEGNVVDELTAAGFELQVVEWRRMSLSEQLVVLEGASLLMGVQGADLFNMVFMRQRTCVVDVMPYCWANASDFWQSSVTMRQRHYAWRNPDPSRSLCHPKNLQCVIPDCGLDPDDSMLILCGTFGGADVCSQDTTVDIEVLRIILGDAKDFLLFGGGAGGRMATSCTVHGREVACTHRLPD